MTKEELISTVKNAKSPEDILKAAEKNGVKDFTPRGGRKGIPQILLFGRAF